MNHLTQITCTSFAEALASKTSVPGGGGAAAMAGALGIALCSMVGNFTVGKKAYAAVEEDVKTIMAEAEALRIQLLELVQADALAFEPLSRAYAIPKDTPGRSQTLEEATLNACNAPIEMVKCCAKAIDLLEAMLEKGSKMLISDVGCGALLCKAAMESAAMNVFVNTKTLLDRNLAGKIDREMDFLLQSQLPKADKIAEVVTRYIRKGD